jgi:hypothetical protein
MENMDKNGIIMEIMEKIDNHGNMDKSWKIWINHGKYG